MIRADSTLPMPAMAQSFHKASRPMAQRTGRPRLLGAETFEEGIGGDGDEKRLDISPVYGGFLRPSSCHTSHRPRNGYRRAEGDCASDNRGVGPSSAIVCNGSGECWHSVPRYDYPQGVQVEVHPFDWSWNDGQHYAWREHPGRGYWQNREWQIF